MKKLVVSLLLLTAPLIGCSSIPENGALLNAKVSEGIAKNQLETEKIIKALGDVERAILNEKWDDIYAKVEEKYLARHSVAEADLTQAQRRAIAANAAKTYYDLRDDISAIEAGLVAKTKANAQAVIDVNDVVTNYLMSLEKLDAATGKIRTKIEDITGIDFSDISGKAVELIEGI